MDIVLSTAHNSLSLLRHASHLRILVLCGSRPPGRELENSLGHNLHHSLEGFTAPAGTYALGKRPKRCSWGLECEEEFHDQNTCEVDGNGPARYVLGELYEEMHSFGLQTSVWKYLPPRLSRLLFGDEETARFMDSVDFDWGALYN